MRTVGSRLGTTSIPQRLLLASALVYGGAFFALAAYGRPGLGIGQAFYIGVILAAAATSPTMGGLAGVGALFLYELAIHHQDGLGWTDFADAPALTRLASYAAAGVVTGFLALRGRRMLAQSLYALEDLVELAHGRLHEPSGSTGSGSGDAASPE